MTAGRSCPGEVMASEDSIPDARGLQHLMSRAAVGGILPRRRAGRPAAGPARRECPGAFPGPARARLMAPAAGAGRVRDLLARASARESVQPGDGKGGAAFERVTVDGTAYFVKRLSAASDWIMRVSGDQVNRPYLVWQAGVMDRAPACIDHTVVAMDTDGAGGDAVLTVVMRDVGGFLVPPGDMIVPGGQHAGFIRHMAALSAAFWDWEDDIGLTTMAQRLRFFAPGTIAGELAAAEVPAPITAAAAGWAALPGRSPLLAGIARLGHDRPG